MLARKPSRKFSSVIALIAALALMAAGCGGREAGTGEEEKTINIGYIAWDEDIAVTNLFKVLLEDRGYTVNTTELEAGPTFAGLAQGNLDLFMDGWLPQTHADYWEQYGDQLEDLGVWYDQATLNIAVPEYLTDINSIEDLKGRAAEFDGTITGIDPGAGLTRTTQEQALPEYGLEGEYNLQTSSTTAMLTSLERSINEQQPIVVTLWHPHWAYERYPIKDLEDPRGAMGETEQLHSFGRQGFSEDFPEVTEMLEKFQLNDEQLASLENEIINAGQGQEPEAARKWAEANPDVINSFAPPR